jgi:hypothetical protein
MATAFICRLMPPTKQIYLNTLYVDKNLRFHGLIQAFSCTNRVLNGSSAPKGGRLRD